MLTLSFTCLFLDDFPLPSLIDASKVVDNYLECTRMPSVVIWFFRRLAWMLNSRKEYFQSLARLSFKSEYFACDHSQASVRSPNLFFELILEEASSLDEDIDIILNFYYENATHIILYNAVSVVRVSQVLTLLNDVGNYVDHFDSCRYRYSDSKECSCLEFKVSGDCYCDCDNVNAGCSSSGESRNGEESHEALGHVSHQDM